MRHCIPALAVLLLMGVTASFCETAAQSTVLGVATKTTHSTTSADIQPFNGKNLDGWLAEGDATVKSGADKGKPIWSVKDGMIRCEGNGGFGFLRYTPREFANFEWELEYQFDVPVVPPLAKPGTKPKAGNSGVGIRTGPFDPKKSWETRPSVASYEIQLLDDAGTPPSPTGSISLYRFVAPKENAVKPSPEWNHLRIRCAGPVIEIQVNGKPVLQFDQTTDPKLKDKPLKGFICLQNHSSGITFRNLKVRDITLLPGMGTDSPK